MGIPTALVERSAAARAAESDSDMEAILAAWGGGEAAPSPATEAPEEPDEAPEPDTEAEAEEAEPTKDTAEEAEPAAAAAAVIEEPEPVAPAPVYEPQPEVELEPVPLAERLRTAVRVGAWTGAGLGLIGFFLATGSWAPNTVALPDSGPVVQVDSSGLLIAVALISIVFGAIVASLSRAAAAWTNPAMQLSGPKSSTAWVGAGVGLVLGLIAGATLSGGFGIAVEGSEGLIQLPVLATLFVMLIGGGVLGALTAAIPQLLGTPVAVGEESEEEIEAVKSRLSGAMSIPMAAAFLLLTLVLPFGYLLIQSNHLGQNGAAIVAILTSAGILGFATLAGGRPEMRVTLGEIMVAVAGIGTVLIIILAVLFYTGQDDDHGTGGGEEATAAVLIVS